MLVVMTHGVSMKRILNNVTSGPILGGFLDCRLHTCLTERAPELSSEKVTEILRTNEFSHEFIGAENGVTFYDSNQLPSNSPMEDTRSEAKCLLSQGTLFGVFDGHSSPACAQIVAKRLFHYICAGLLPKDALRQYSQSLEGKAPPMDILERYNETYDLLPELQSFYQQRFAKYVHNLMLADQETTNVMSAMEKAILSLDRDMSAEALECESPELAPYTMQAAMAGSVGCVVHVDGSHLHVANVGDCRAVLGTLTRENVWKAKLLTRDHNARNIYEVNRIRAEHPASEKNTVLEGERLLGYLAPLRAFGDFSYKWSREVLNEVVKSKLPPELIRYVELIKWQSRSYLTPPYLTVQPEISHCRLLPDDKFLIIATDGLWDEISSVEAVRLVAAHLRGKTVLDPFVAPEPNMKLKDIHRLLVQRKQYFDVKPVDRNSATHLLRNALGCRASYYLAIPADTSRFYRDDISITVVYFDVK